MKQYIFNNTTNYAEVEAAIKAEYSKVVSELCGCGCHSNDKLCDIVSYFKALDIDKTTNQVRYKNDVKAIYKLLNSNCGC